MSRRPTSIAPSKTGLVFDLNTHYEIVRRVAENIQEILDVDANFNDLDRYHGALVENPTTRRSGSVLRNGDFYLNTDLDSFVYYNSVDDKWIQAPTLEILNDITDSTVAAKVAAEAARNEAQAFANAEEDELINGSYSAYHWAQKAKLASYEVVVSNPQHIIATDTSGTPISLGNTGTDILVYKDNTPLQAVSANPSLGEFSVVTTTNNVTMGEPVLTGPAYSYGDITDITAPTGTILFTINVEGLGVRTGAQTFSKIANASKIASTTSSEPDENGDTVVTLTFDDEATTEFTVKSGTSITVISQGIDNEDNTLVYFSDGSFITVQKGVKGDKGDKGGSALTVAITSDQGYTFRNGKGTTKLLIANVYDDGNLLTDIQGIKFTWYSGSDIIQVTNDGHFVSITPTMTLYPADGTNSVNGLNLQTIKVDPTDVPEGSSLHISCQIVKET